MDIYIASAFFPSRLVTLGLKNTLGFFGIKKISEIPHDGVCIFLGSDWHRTQVWSFAKKHKENGGRIIQMIHDLIPVSCPIYHQSLEKTAFESWLDFCFSHTTDFVCVSKYTASDLKNFSDKKGHSLKIKVVPLAHEFLGCDRSEVIFPVGGLSGLLSQRYVLCVGTMEYRKNNMMLLKAWKQLHADIPGQLPLLVFAGRPGSGYIEMLNFLSHNTELSHYVKIIEGPEDIDLASMYQHCLFTVYLSHYEGWGLPVGESAWFGKYCIASRATSIPEVCGDLMEYVDPDNLDELTKVLKKAISDDAYRASREENIKKSQARTWNHVVDDLYEILQAG